MSGKRKQNGEGSVFQVSENKWVAKISLGTRPDGKSNIKQFSGKTEAIVKVCHFIPNYSAIFGPSFSGEYKRLMST